MHKPGWLEINIMMLLALAAGQPQRLSSMIFEISRAIKPSKY